jgi:valyl-tRNA synthetase
MPFITSELWETFYPDRAPLHQQPYPVPDDFSPQEEDGVDLFTCYVIEPVEAIRALRGEMNIPPSEPLPLSLAFREDLSDGQKTVSASAKIEAATPYLIQMARLSGVTVIPSSPERPATNLVITLTTSLFDLQIELDALRRDREIERLEAEQKKIDTHIQPLRLRLANPNFAKAPQAVQDEHRTRLADLETARLRCTESLARLRPKGDPCDKLGD